MNTFYNKNLIGEKFGELTVIEEAPPLRIARRNAPAYICLCSCGKQKIIARQYLVRGSSKSCGCMMTIRDVHRQMTIEQRFYNTWKVNSSVKQKGYELTLHEFIDIVYQNCFYCDLRPSQCYTANNESILFTGIDRVDNTIGYINSNCVPCCPTCNRMKLNQTQRDFFEKIKRIYNLHLI